MLRICPNKEKDASLLLRRTALARVSVKAVMYGRDESKEQVKAVLDRVLTWPSERRQDAAKLLMLMESQDESIYRLTDEQVGEVRRRRADQNTPKLTLDEFRERLRRRLGE
jgi:hypothetical protein